MPSLVWYFAYAGDMSRVQMHSRAGEIAEEKNGKLENYEIVFNKKARGGSATANIRPASGKAVHGVLFRIPESGLKALERLQGVPQHYRRIEVTVTDSEGNRMPAQAFIASKVDKGLRPAGHYVQAILQGADEHQLPADYIAELKKTAGVE
jgi:gamma-glutamylcyclotransferase (GGCT)/AIG2-like uncharacterized protein YtfP